MISNTRAQYFLIIALLLSLSYHVYTHLNVYYFQNKNLYPELLTDSSCKSKEQSIKEFYQIASKTKTDKITTHSYQFLYGEYLGNFRNKKINFLEIGLGCGMPYGPGKSIPVWKEYLPYANVSILEYNAQCAEPFRAQVNNLYTGDQSDFKILEMVARGGPYDVIIDDGGHSRKQQINSLIGLWSSIKPGGFYIMEDMQTSFISDYNDNKESSFDFTAKLIEKLLNSGVGTQISKEQESIMNTLLSIHCFRETCIYIKKALNQLS